MTIPEEQIGIIETRLKPTYFPEEELVKRPAEILAQYGYLPSEPGPVDIESFVERIADFSYSDNLPDDIDGVTVFAHTGRPRVIIPNRLAMGEASIVYLRSTIAHECAHVIFHNDCFKQACNECTLGSPLAGSVACRSPQVDSGYRWYEWQANFAGASFLMPYMHVRTLFKSIIDKWRIPTDPPIFCAMGYLQAMLSSQIQNVFEVGSRMAEIAAEQFLRRNAAYIQNLIHKQYAA